MRITVVCVGRVRAPFADDCAHYEKLLGRLAKLELVELKESGLDHSDTERALALEAALIERRIPDGSELWVLDREGDARSSRQIAADLGRLRDGARELCVVVGGPFGLDSSIVGRAASRLSFGPVTLPHQLARVVLLEQLFRAHKILLGQKYHY